MMFVLNIFISISRGLEFGSENFTSIYKHSELNVFKNIKLFGEIFSNWPNDFY